LVTAADCFLAFTGEFTDDQRRKDTMSNPHIIAEMRGVRGRAAEVRRRWSPAERRSRIGLPPDAPWMLLRSLFENGQLDDLRMRHELKPSPVVVKRAP
jgi:hypothetical protein